MPTIEPTAVIWTNSSARMVNESRPNDIGHRMSYPTSLDELIADDIKYFNIGIIGVTIAAIRSIAIAGITCDVIGGVLREAQAVQKGDHSKAAHLEAMVMRGNGLVIGSLAIKIDDREIRRKLMREVEKLTIDVFELPQPEVKVLLGRRPDDGLMGEFRDKFGEGKVEVEIFGRIFRGLDSKSVVR